MPEQLSNNEVGKPLTRGSGQAAKEGEQLIEVINEIVYLPNNDQRRAKAEFWVRFSDSPLCDPSQISLSVVNRLVSVSRMDRWWKIPGFSDWFKNREEFRERVEQMVHLGLDTLENIMLDEKAQASAKVNAVKLLMEIGKKMPPKSIKEVYHIDEKIGRMDTRELEDFIKKNTPKLIEEAPKDE